MGWEDWVKRGKPGRLLGSWKAFRNIWKPVCPLRGCQPEGREMLSKQGACLVSLVSGKGSLWDDPSPGPLLKGPLSGWSMPSGILDVKQASYVGSFMPHLLCLLCIPVRRITSCEICYSIPPGSFCGLRAGQKVSIGSGRHNIRYGSLLQDFSEPFICFFPPLICYYNLSSS